jgi:hypothetical protein
VHLRFELLLVVVLLTALCASAQNDRGTITGRVTDPSSAVVPGVEVTATNVDTRVVSRSTSNDLGFYTILNLPIGTYNVDFKAQGFKTFTQEHVTLSIGQVAKIDAALAVGAASESVSVEADASPLATETANVGTNMKGNDLTILPLSVAGGRDVSNFAFAAVPTVIGNNWSTSIAGSQTMSKSIVVDGTDANAGIQGTQPPPGMEAVQQFEVQTVVGTDAAASGGGAFMYTLKSGTNTLHGSGYGFLANEALDANTWDNNFFGNPRARDRYKDWGFSAGGPVYLPKIYDGRNKTFVFGSYEHYDQTDLRFNTASSTVPTTAMLGGDFSALLDKSVNFGTDSAGNTIYRGAIFDPLTQNVFVNDIIPSNRISGQSKKIIDLFKTYAPMSDSLTNNYGSLVNGSPIFTKHNLDLKVDQNFGDKNHLSGSINYYRTPNVSSGGLWQYGSSDPGALGYNTQSSTVTSKGIRFIDDHIITSNLFNTVSVAYNNWHKDETTDSAVDNAALGFKVPEGPAKNNFPIMDFGCVNTFTQICEPSVGSRFGYTYEYTQWHIRDGVSWLKGRHNLKFGGELTLFRPSDSGSSQYYSYSFSQSTGLPNWLYNDSAAAQQLGFGFANFLLGEVGSASQGTGLPSAGGRNSLNFFLNDAIKVTPKFTVNLGVRWDFNTPWHEYHGHWTNFTLDAENPSWAPLKGAYQYAKSGSDSWEKNQAYRQFSPYIGAAYQVTPKLVARGSWGMHFVPLGINQWGTLPYNIDGQAQGGYIGTNNTANASVAPNATAFNWDNTIYGGTFIPASADSSANRIFSWATITVDPDMLHLGKVQNWNVGVQYELAKDTILDVNYVGNIGWDLHNGSLNPLNYPTLSTYLPLLNSGHANDFVTTAAEAAAAGVPWYPFLTTTVGGSGGYNAYAAISPYPQTLGSGSNPILFSGSPLGKSAYHALIVEFKKRGSNGLAADLNYTLQRATTNTDSTPGIQDGGAMTEGWKNSSPWQDPYAYDSYSGTVAAGIPQHQIKGYLVYELPFGHGKKWLSKTGALNYLVGGWQLGTLVSYRSGLPIRAVSASFSYPGWSSVYANQTGSLSDTFKSLDLNNLSNASNLMFSPNSFTDPAYGEFGTRALYSYDFTSWAYFNEDFSILKSFGFGPDGRYRVSLRGEFFDVLNRHHWNDPNTGATNTTYFGAVTGVSGNRRGQVGARFEW